VSWEKGRGYARKDQTREYGDGEYVLLDLLSALRLGGSEDDALDPVVYSATCLEGDGVGGACEIVEICLEQPKCQKRAVDRLLAQVYYEFLQSHGLIVDADEQVT
jgi:hypothetical protein